MHTLTAHTERDKGISLQTCRGSHRRGSDWGCMQARQQYMAERARLQKAAKLTKVAHATQRMETD